GERHRDRRGGTRSRNRHRGQDGTRADDREDEGREGPGPRVVRGVRPGEGARGRGGGDRRAGRQGWPGRRADRAQDFQCDLPREDRRGGVRRLVVRVDRRLLQNVDWALLIVAFALIMMSSVTLASLHEGPAGGSVVIRELLWITIGLAVIAL